MINAIKKRFKLLQLPVAILAGFTVAFAFGCGADSPGQSTSLPPISESAIIPIEKDAAPINKDMDQQNTVDVKPGTWGGRGIVFVIEKNSVSIELDRANATISSRLRTRKDGRFTATGILVLSGLGPVRHDSPPQRQPVKFEGKITGNQMTLKITFIDSGSLISDFVLERGKQGELVSR